MICCEGRMVSWMRLSTYGKPIRVAWTQGVDGLFPNGRKTGWPLVPGDFFGWWFVEFLQPDPVSHVLAPHWSRHL
jgi:hypothetical protein